MDSFHITEETANALDAIHGFRENELYKSVPFFIKRDLFSDVYEIDLLRRTYYYFTNSSVPFLELNVDQVLGLLVLPTAESLQAYVDSYWDQFADTMHSAKLLHKAMCFAH